ncbi:MAG: hypothetical protein WC654_01740 [Patescibacteria group bacterium]
MGLFGRLLGKEGAQPKETVESPKAEAVEAKGSREMGKERVDKMLATARDAKNAAMTKTGNVLGRVGGALRDAFFATIGGSEKGGKAAVSGAVEGGKAVTQYARETKAEVGQIVTSGIEKGNKLDDDVAAFLQTNATAGVDKLNGFADWVLSAEKELKEKAPGVHADILARAEKGAQDVGNEITAAVTEGIKQFNAFKEWAGAARKEFAQKRSDVHQDVLDRAADRIQPFANVADQFARNVLNLPRDVNTELGILTAKAGAAKDRFTKSVNEARMKATGTAELKGEVLALRAEVAKLAGMVKAYERISTIVPESQKVIGDETVDAEAETIPKTVAK